MCDNETNFPPLFYIINMRGKRVDSFVPKKDKSDSGLRIERANAKKQYESHFQWAKYKTTVSCASSPFRGWLDPWVCKCFKKMNVADSTEPFKP